MFQQQQARPNTLFGGTNPPTLGGGTGQPTTLFGAQQPATGTTPMFGGLGGGINPIGGGTNLMGGTTIGGGTNILGGCTNMMGAMGQPNMFGQQQQQPSLFGNQGQTQQPMGQQFQWNQPMVNKDCAQVQEELKKKQSQLEEVFKQMSQPYVKPNIAQYTFDLAKKIDINTEDLVKSYNMLLIQQRELAKKLDEYISTLGIIEKLSIDGLAAVKKEDLKLQELGLAEGGLRQSYHKFVQSNTRTYDNDLLHVPQEYEEKLIEQQGQRFQNLAESVEKLIYYYNKQPQLTVDETLNSKLSQMQTLAQYSYLLQLRIRNIEERTNNFKTKTFNQLYPDKRIEEFNSIDSTKDRLDSIINQEM